jgi:hypothetical protein
MRKYRILMLALLLMGLAATTAVAEKEKGDASRLLTGKVVDHNDAALTGGIVYLSNTRTQMVKTYITGPDGSFRFPALSPNVDYQVYAQFKGRKSDTKTVSQFDNRQQVSVVLKIDTK